MADHQILTAAEKVRRRHVAEYVEQVRVERATRPDVAWPIAIGTIEGQAQIALADPHVDLRQTLEDIATICRTARGAA